MSITTIYIDTGDEITTVIERLKSSHDPIVALVVPKGAILLQSIVNLKLAKKAAIDAEKDLIIVTTDKIGRNLATQVGISLAHSEKEIEKVASGRADTAPSDEEPKVIAGVRIHRYYEEEKEAAENESPPETEPRKAEVLIPRRLMVEKPAPKEEPAATAPTPPPSLPVASEAEAEPPPPEEPLAEAVPAVDDEKLVPPPEEAVPVATSNGFKRTSIDQPSSPASSSASAVVRHAHRRRGRMWSFLVFLLILLVAAGAVGSTLVYPRTTVALTVQAAPWTSSLTVQAKPDQATVATDGSAVPTETLKQETDASLTFSATGTKTIGQAATGTATVFNSQDSSPQSLPAGARLVANGQAFLTDGAVTIPGVQVKSGNLIAGSATVAIHAEKVGSDSNMSGIAANITSPANTNMYAQITKADGGNSQDLKVITADDITKAKAALSDQLRATLVKKIQEQIGTRTVYSADAALTFTLSNYTTSHAADDQADSATAQAHGLLEEIIVSDQTLQNAAVAALTQAQTTTEKRVLDKAQATETGYDAASKTFAFTVALTGKSTPLFTTDSLPTQLAGKSRSAGEKIIQATTPANTKIEIKERPAWWPLHRFPGLSRSITITTTYE